MNINISNHKLPGQQKRTGNGCYILRFFLLFQLAVLAFLSPVSVQADTHPSEKTVTISFIYRQSKTDVDLSYMDNVGEYLQLKNVIASLDDMHAKSISFTGSASPEGTYAINKRLTQKRADKVVSMLCDMYPKIFDSNIKTDVTLSTESWNKVVRRLKRSKIEGREEAIRLIESYKNNLEDEHQAQVLKMQLGKICEGRTWNAMYQEIFPYTRCGTITIVFEPDVPQAQRDTVVIKQETVVQPTRRDTIVIMKETVIRQDAQPYVSAVISPDTVVLTQVKKLRQPWMAVKTNVLFDLALSPNVELEFPIGKRFSLMLEHWFPWWIFGNDKHALEVLYSGGEFRYWLGDRSDKAVLQGMFLGVYGGATEYDIEYNEKGYQGESVLCAGLTFGKSWRLSKRWRMEASLSVGYLHTDYRYYEHNKDIDLLIWQHDGMRNWIGPTKLKVSFGWLLGMKKTKKGGNK